MPPTTRVITGGLSVNDTQDFYKFTVTQPTAFSVNLSGLASTAQIFLMQDVNGNEFEIDGMELTARCMLHETDHCDGIVFLDKMSPIKRELVKRKIKKLQKAGQWF